MVCPSVQCVNGDNVFSYSETTWALGIAQLTHHEVQGPHRGPSGELIAQYRPPMSFCSLSQTLFG